MSSQAEINAACIQLSFQMTTLIPCYMASLKTWFFWTIYHLITSTTIFMDRSKAWRQSLRSGASGTICVFRMEVKHYLETVLSVNYHRRLAMHLPEVLLLNLCLMMQRIKTPSLKTTRAWTHLQLVACVKYYHSRPIFEQRSPSYSKSFRMQGINVFFLPKFHCKLNPIEMYWEWVKIHKQHALPLWWLYDDI